MQRSIGRFIIHSAAVGLSLFAAAPVLAQIEYVPLAAPCNGKEGLAIAGYSWFSATALEREFVFTEVCVDLTRMKVFSVEDSDPFELAFKGPGQAEYHSYPPGYTDTYRETMTLFTDVLVPDATAEALEDVTDPEAPGSIATFAWSKAGTVRPLQRHGLANVRINGFVGGFEPSGTSFHGPFWAGGSHLVSTYRDNAGLSGLGFALEGEVRLDGNTGTARFTTNEHVSTVTGTELSFTLRLDGNEISGEGRFSAENANLAPANGEVWKSFDMQSAGVVGRVMGTEGDKLYLLAVFEGTYTNHAGEVLRATTAMNLFGTLVDDPVPNAAGEEDRRGGQIGATD